VTTPQLYQNTLANFTAVIPSSSSVCGSGDHRHIWSELCHGAGTTSAIYDTSGNGMMNSADQAGNIMVMNGIAPGGQSDGFSHASTTNARWVPLAP
jgi:hypothetical protein